MGNLLIGSCFARGATKSRYGRFFGLGGGQRQNDQMVILTKPLKAERAGARRTPSRAPARNAMRCRRSLAAARASTATPRPDAAPSPAKCARSNCWGEYIIDSVACKFVVNIWPNFLRCRDIIIATHVIAFLLLCKAASIERCW